MAAELLSFFRPARSVSGDWSSQEIAEFYRVEAALVQAGVSVFVDRGVSDEGDPWFVFCRSADGEVIVHFARISGNYLIAADSIGRPVQGPDFRKVLADFVAINPTLIPIRSSGSAKLMLHPASLLAAIVASALYYMSGTEAIANTLDPAAIDGNHSPGPLASPSDASGDANGHSANRKWSDWQVAAVVSALVTLAAAEHYDVGKESLSDLASIILNTSGDQIVLPHSVVADASAMPDLAGKAWTDASSDARLLFDNFILSGGGQAVDQQFQVTASDGLVQKFLPAAPAAAQDPAAGEHWWTPFIHGGETGSQSWTEASSGTPIDAGPKGMEQVVPLITAPAGQGSSTQAAVADSEHSNSTAGSSSPDHAATVTETSSAPAALAFVNNELSAANKTAPQISLTGSLSLQDVIGHGASNLFGPSIPPALSAADPVGGHVAASTSGDTSGLLDSAVLTTNSAAANTVGASQSPVAAVYLPFNAAANELLDAFVRQNTFDVLTSNNHVVLLDNNPADFSSPDFVTRTWSMSDGSTISIVGAVPHNLVAVA